MERSMLVTVMRPRLAAWLGLSRDPPGGAEPRGSCLADLPSRLEHCSPRWCAPLSRRETIMPTPCIPRSIALPVHVCSPAACVPGRVGALVGYRGRSGAGAPAPLRGPWSRWPPPRGSRSMSSRWTSSTRVPPRGRARRSSRRCCAHRDDRADHHARHEGYPRRSRAHGLRAATDRRRRAIVHVCTRQEAGRPQRPGLRGFQLGRRGERVDSSGSSGSSHSGYWTCSRCAHRRRRSHR